MRRVPPEVDDVDLLGPQLQQSLPVDADGLVRLARHKVAGDIEHLLHEEIGAALVLCHRLVQRHHLRATSRALSPPVIGPLLLRIGLPGDELQRLLSADAGLRLEFHQRKNVEAKEGSDERMPAVDATVEVGSQQRVRRHAPIADWQEVVLVAVRLRSDGETRQVDLVLPRRGHPQDLQLVIGHPSQLVSTQALGLLRQRVEDVHTGNAQRHLPQ
mmetsp:Transcript_118085/g.252304  ORF Transcript_118085/g.252304 Transcript_118085/m.252304 type:complete len:215 (+) Transcript_118085:251-895(+)